jgi:nucleotide-binding universal stress UspA family protein
MGTRGCGGVDHLILGSTTERVVVHSRCPVLATRDVGHNITT